MKTSLVAKMLVFLIFVFGVISYATSKKTKTQPDTPKSFVITSLISRSKNGEPPVVTGIVTKIVSTDGQYKRVIARRPDNENHRDVTVSYMDNVATYRLEIGRLEYEDSSETLLQRDKVASSPEWITQSALYRGEDTMLGLKVYRTRQELGNGFLEQAFSPLTRSSPLYSRERDGSVDYIEEAIAVQFREVQPEEIVPPNVPITFGLAQRFEKAITSNPENTETAKRYAERRASVTSKLLQRGRSE